jgi:uncharacterized protein YjbI with pentapeptide repeats
VPATKPSPRSPERKKPPSPAETVAELIKTTNDDVARTRTELLFFLGAIAFIVLTIFGIDDHSLLIGTRINLPILGASIDLNSFLGGSPVLLVCIHFVMLLKFRSLREKCEAIETQLRQVRRETLTGAHAKQLCVTSNFLTQWVVGRERNGVFAWLNFIVYFVCLYAAPIVALLFLMLRTLPLHNNFLTTFQSITLFIDIWLSIYVTGRANFWLASAVALPISFLIALIFSVPDSPLDRFGRSYLISAAVPYGMPNATRQAFWPAAFFLESEVNLATGHPVRLLSRNLNVVNAQIGPSEYDPRLIANSYEASEKGRPSIPFELRTNLSGRNLRYANLDYTNLRGAILIAADLTGADLRYADLTDSILGCTARGVAANDPITEAAKANCTKFDAAILEGVRFTGAVNQTTFSGVSYSASFADADLSFASFANADVPFLILNRADLSRASLFGANLSDASLVGTNLTGANLTGATMIRANAAFGSFGGAILTGADLEGGHFEIAAFDYASLAGANLQEATLWGASFRGADLWAATPPNKESASWSDFAKAITAPPSPSDRAQLEQSLNLLRNDQRFSGTKTFSALISNAKDAKLQQSKNNEIWKNWLSTLTVATYDEGYREALSRLITSVGCRDEQSARAINKWAVVLPATNESAGVPFAEGDPLPEVDHRLDKLIEAPSPNYETGFLTVDDLINPLPQWYDLTKYLNALEHPDACNAAKQASPALVTFLRDAIRIRNAKPAVH